MCGNSQIAHDAGAADGGALKRKRSMQDSVQHLRRLASEKSAQLSQATMGNLSSAPTGTGPPKGQAGAQAGAADMPTSRLRCSVLCCTLSLILYIDSSSAQQSGKYTTSAWHVCA